MSAEAVRAALGVKGLTPGVKFVLVVMAEHANSESFLSWPSAALVAEETGLARPTVATALKALRERGLITEAGRVRQVIRYRVDPRRLVALRDMSPDADGVSPVVRHLSPVSGAPVMSADTEQEGTTRGTTKNHQDAEASAILAAWWERQNPKPAGRGAWHSGLNVVKGLLKAGHSPAAVAAAMQTAGVPLTMARVEIELGKRRPKGQPYRNDVWDKQEGTGW